MKTGSNDFIGKLRTISLTVAFVCAVAGLGFGAYGWHTIPNKGDLGGFLQGTTGSLWSLASVCLVFVAFLAQLQQMAKQDEEITAQQNQFAAQQANQLQQNFESTLFQLLNIQQQLIAAMVDNEAFDASGRACFRKWRNELKNRFLTNWNPADYLKYSETDKSLREREYSDKIYLAFYERHASDLGHYFRTLYHTFKYIHESAMPDKRKYTSLVRAQLSQDELALLYYNCISEHGDRFEDLAIEYGLFNNLDLDYLLHKSHESYYQPKAFL